MKGVIFFDIDTQYDFMHRDGKFYVQDAEKIIPNLGSITQFALINNIPVFASIDNNGFKKEDGEWNQLKIPETRLRNAAIVPNKKLTNKKIMQLKKEDKLLIEKHEHNAFSNPNLKSIVNGTKKAYVYGVATDYCVKEVVLELRSMKVETYVIKDAIKPVSKKTENKHFALFRKKGAKFLTTRQLLRKKEL
ncbi:cysteine hydrolase [Candidatus Woesearchaeota archaeon]|nr:cysteine hydrolase [Candidatus Woesearchaeota archaeon]